MISKKTSKIDLMDLKNGEEILIDKGLNRTSCDIVNKVKRILGIKKVGHAGTLDPKATGLLILCTGKKTKSISVYQNLMKEYVGKIYLGKVTPTMDTESEPINEKDISKITVEKIIEISKKFEGNIQQVPPVFSANWVNGKRAYKLARKGREVNLKPKNIFIENISILSYNPPLVEFKVKCSKGTYIRKLASDIGEELGCGGFLYELKRTRIGDYIVEDALSLNELEELIKVNNVN